MLSDLCTELARAGHRLRWSRSCDLQDHQWERRRAFTVENQTGQVWVVGDMDKEVVDQYTLTILAEDGGESCCQHFPCCLSCGSVAHSCYWSTCNTVAVGVFAVSRGGPWMWLLVTMVIKLLWMLRYWDAFKLAGFLILELIICHFKICCSELVLSWMETKFGVQILHGKHYLRIKPRCSGNFWSSKTNKTALVKFIGFFCDISIPLCASQCCLSFSRSN